MPKKIVIQLFSELFQMDKFIVNENTILLLANGNLNDFRKKVKNKRDLSRLIAKCEYFNYQPFSSMSKIFQTSIEAMAIRLEELDLIEF